MVDEETGRIVEGENKGRGYELSSGKYVEIESEELDAVEVESTHSGVSEAPWQPPGGSIPSGINLIQSAQIKRPASDPHCGVARRPSSSWT
jgi:hypothetical protein